MKIPGVTESNGRYYRIVQSGERDERGRLKRQWIPLTRVDEGPRALIDALEAFRAQPQRSGMQQAITDYLRHHLPTLTPAVRKEHERMFDKIAAEFAAFAVEQVRPRDCLDFLALFNGHPSARRAYKYRLSAFFGWCVLQELCDTNPLREITVKAPPKFSTPWNDDNFLDIRDRLDPMMQCYHDLEYLLWQRSTDVRLLLRKQITATQIHITPSKTARSSGASVKIDITPSIAAVIERAAQISRELGVISPYVIHTSTGTSYTRSGVYSAYRRADIALNGHATGLNPKAIRPYVTTKAEAQGHDLRELQLRLAHAERSTTEGYVHRHQVPVSSIDMPLPVRRL
jgi:integrase